MKNEFKARAVYLSKDERITARFTTCFLSLVLLRYLEKNLMKNIQVQKLLIVKKT